MTESQKDLATLVALRRANEARLAELQADLASGRETYRTIGLFVTGIVIGLAATAAVALLT